MPTRLASRPEGIPLLVEGLTYHFLHLLLRYPLFSHDLGVLLDLGLFHLQDTRTASPVDLQVSNLDQTIDQRKMKEILHESFRYKLLFELARPFTKSRGATSMFKLSVIS